MKTIKKIAIALLFITMFGCGSSEHKPDVESFEASYSDTTQIGTFIENRVDPGFSEHTIVVVLDSDSKHKYILTEQPLSSAKEGDPLNQVEVYERGKLTETYLVVKDAPEANREINGWQTTIIRDVTAEFEQKHIYPPQETESQNENDTGTRP